MDKNNLANMIRAKFRIAHILFRTDLQNSSGIDIHIGVLAEMDIIDEWTVFGMSVRTTLNGDEINSLPNLWRERLTHPIVYFDSVFDEAWAESGKDQSSTIDYLSTGYNSSLLVTPAKDLPAPAELRKPNVNLLKTARNSVIDMLEDESLRFLDIVRPATMQMSRAA